MQNTKGQRWARTTGANIGSVTTDESGREHGPVGRKFKLMPVPDGHNVKQVTDDFTILAVDPVMSGPTFTYVKVSMSSTGSTFFTKLTHNQAYLVPENQR